MKPEEHMEKDVMVYGESFEHVHLDLDSTVSMTNHPHRKDTHFLEYVMNKWLLNEWNEQECACAVQHIIDDCGVVMVKSDWE